MDKGCHNCVYLGRPSYEYPCTVCETAYGSAPSKWEGMVSATADIVEVVRCKDCRFILDRVDGTHGCYRHFMDDCNPDDFCSYGERKDND